MTPNQPDDRKARADALLPCPFCEGEAHTYKYEQKYRVYCISCAACTVFAFNLDKAITAWNSRRSPASAATTMGETDDPQWDGTDAAHPAWWRGQECGCRETIRVVNEWLDGDGLGGTMRPPFEALKERIVALAKAEEKRQRLETENEQLKNQLATKNSTEFYVTQFLIKAGCDGGDMWAMLRTLKERADAAQALALRAQVEELEKEKRELYDKYLEAQEGWQLSSVELGHYEELMGKPELQGMLEKCEEWQVKAEQIKAHTVCGLCGEAATDSNALFTVCENCSSDGTSTMPKEVFELSRRVASLTAAREQAIEAAASLFDDHKRGTHQPDCLQDICDCADHAAAIRAIGDGRLVAGVREQVKAEVVEKAATFVEQEWYSTIKSHAYDIARGIRALLGEKGDEG